jgi:2'-hydroxyisoflavone reductase
MADAGQARDERVLAPGEPTYQVRPIDVRDVAVFTLNALERRLQGPYLVAGTPDIASGYGDLLQACVEVTGSPARLEWVDADFLLAQNVAMWTELPLWVPPGEHPWELDTSRAEAAGLRCRPLRETVADTWAWLADGDGEVRRSYRASRPHGLEAEREREVLAAWDARRDEAAIG